MENCNTFLATKNVVVRRIWHHGTRKIGNLLCEHGQIPILLKSFGWDSHKDTRKYTVSVAVRPFGIFVKTLTGKRKMLKGLYWNDMV